MLSPLNSLEAIVKELARIAKPENMEAIKLALGEQARGLHESEPLIQAGRHSLERYFSEIKGEFSADWGNTDSLLMCAKYIGAFIRLLGTFIGNTLTINQMHQQLGNIKRNILEKYSEGRTNQQSFAFAPGAFHSYRNEEGEEVSNPLPSKREGSIEQIHKLLNENRGSNSQS